MRFKSIGGTSATHEPFFSVDFYSYSSHANSYRTFKIKHTCTSSSYFYVLLYTAPEILKHFEIAIAFIYYFVNLFDEERLHFSNLLNGFIATILFNGAFDK